MLATTRNAPTSAARSSVVADLLSRVSDGDPTAWEEIVRRYGRLVAATVRSFRLQNADALDAVQMTWLRLGENALRIQSPERLPGWLATTTAANACTSCAKPSGPRALSTSLTPPWTPSGVRSMPTPYARCGTLSMSCRPASGPCYGLCSPTIPVPTPRSPAPPESARRDRPTRARALAKLRCSLEQCQPIGWMPRKQGARHADTWTRMGHVWTQS
jgi:hypothetical protein